MKTSSSHHSTTRIRWCDGGLWSRTLMISNQVGLNDEAVNGTGARSFRRDLIPQQLRRTNPSRPIGGHAPAFPRRMAAMLSYRYAVHLAACGGLASVRIFQPFGDQVVQVRHVVRDACGRSVANSASQTDPCPDFESASAAIAVSGYRAIRYAMSKAARQAVGDLPPKRLKALLNALSDE